MDNKATNDAAPSAAYIIRSKPHGVDREDQFLNGRISIGWPCGSSLQGKKRSEIALCLQDKRGNLRDLTETAVSMVRKFVHMPAGSIVLTPSVKNREIVHVFKTTSAYQYDPSADSDEVGNPHFVSAEFIKTVSRSSLPLEVIRSLSGARKTLSDISQYSDVLADYIESDFETEDESVLEDSDAKADALGVLRELLNSEDENVRLQAAIAILAS